MKIVSIHVFKKGNGQTSTTVEIDIKIYLETKNVSNCPLHYLNQRESSSAKGKLSIKIISDL